ncbi:MAG: universal stress protein [Acidobacteria bacterium]|nr:MAG: universal stress protein [Acidobacteriota bacterium]
MPGEDAHPSVRHVHRRILIGYQDSPEGLDALALGRVLAEITDGSLTVATVYPWPRGLMTHEDLSNALAIESTDTFAKVRDLLPGLDVETVPVAEQSISNALGKLAEDRHAAVIVVGSCHHGAVGETFLGSTGASLLHGAPCAVMVAPRGYRDGPTERPRRIGVGFDGSPESWAALETAIAFAELEGGELVVISVADYPKYGYATVWTVLTAGEIQDAERAEMRRTQELALGRVPGSVNAEGRLLTGSPGALLAEASADVDLMVVGSRGHGPLRRTLLGSTARKLVSGSRSPLLVVPRGTSMDPLGLRRERAGEQAAA